MKNTLFLAIDFINDIIHPDGKIAASADYVKNNQTIEKANRALSIARAQAIHIIHVKVGFSTNYIECPDNSPVFSRARACGALQLNTWGTDFHEQLDVQSTDTILIKHRVSSFYATPLATILSANGVTKVVVCGVSTNMAIESVTRELHDRDFQVIVVQDACAAANASVHQASLASLERLAIVCNSDELLKKLKN